MRLQLSRRHRETAVIGISIASGVVGVLAGGSPVGVPLFDGIVTIAAFALVTWISSVAPWWALCLTSGVALAFSRDLTLVGLAVAALVASYWVGSKKRMQRVTRSVIVAVILNIIIRFDVNLFTGESAIIGCSVALLLVGSATPRLTRTRRRVVTWGMAIFGTALFLVVTGQGASVLAARATLTSVVDDMRDGIRLFADGDTNAAVEQLDIAARNLEWVLSTLDATWTKPAKFVPIISQNRHALISLTEDAHSLTRQLAAELTRFNLDDIKPKDGRVDLAKLSDLTSATRRILQSLEGLRIRIDDFDSVWLAQPLARELRALRTDGDEYLWDARRIYNAMVALPDILGAQEARRYFIAFTTPAEARGGGGFMGSWAEIVTNQGRITLERVGRTGLLNSTGAGERRVTGPDDFLRRYGGMGFSDPDTGETAFDVWSVINLSPHFPSTAEVIAELYPQSGGRTLDGVFSLDAYALATLVDFTGPITLTSANTTLDGDNTAQFLLYDQYRLEETPTDRVGVLEEITQEVVERILQGSLPEPSIVFDQMLPLVQDGRITAYSVRGDEQSLYEQLNVDGSLESAPDSDALALTFNNASANKIDVFLDAELVYDVKVDQSGTARSTATITLRNSSPRTGWPTYTIGNGVGLPLGWNRLWVTVHSALSPTSASVDGVVKSIRTSGEQGLYAVDFFVDIPPNSDMDIVIDFEGTLAIDPDSQGIPLILRLPSAVRPVPAKVTYTGPDGVTRSAVVDRPGTHRGFVPAGQR